MQRQIAVAVIVGISLILTACAKRSGAIVATNVPVSAYVTESCKKLTHELINEKNNLATLSQQQNNAANGDALAYSCWRCQQAAY